ncbi:FecR protein [anaerobic digester metagenome]
MSDNDFLCDDLFIYWRLHPTKELDSFWEEYLLENKKASVPFNEAIEAFEMIRNEHHFDESSLREKLNERIKKHKNKNLYRIFASSAAAILLLTLISTFYILNRMGDREETDISSTGVMINNSSVQLVTGNKVLEIDNNSTLNLSEKKHSALITNSLAHKEIDLKDNQSNRLIVPYGKRSTLVLADGSKVLLNSGTKMEFPSMFSGEDREIRVEGEIFIDVVKQDNVPFIIQTPNSRITVFGTSFNVSSYSDEKSESVVLVDGSVEVRSGNSALILKPNEMAVIKDGYIEYKAVDVLNYICWTSGYMQLNKTPLNDVLRKIERYYNVIFQYNDDLKLNVQTCSGKLFLSDNFDDVLEAFSKMTYLQYEKHDDKFIFIHK